MSARARASLSIRACALAAACGLALACGSPSSYRPSPPLTLSSDHGRERPPEALPAREQAQAAIESFVLPNGMRVIAVQRGELPLVVVRYVALAAGNEDETPGDVGLPELTARALVSAGTQTAGGMLRDVEISGMPVEPEVGETFASLQYQVGSEGMRDAISALARTVRYPLFAQLQAPRRQLEHEIVRRWTQLQWDGLLQSLLFGSRDRRGVLLGRRIEALRAYDITALRAWHARYVPAQSALIVVGRFDGELLRSSATTAFADWKAVRSSFVPSVRGSDRPSVGDHVLNIDTNIGAITLAYPSVGMTHEDFWNTRLVAHALGVTPTSATWLALRHRSGLSYFVDAGVRANRVDGQIVVQTFLDARALGDGLDLLLDATTRFASQGLDDHELIMAKRALLDELELRSETNAAVAATLGSLLVFGDPAQTLPRLRASIEATTLAAVNRAAKRFLQPYSRVLLVSGPYRPGDWRLQRLHEPSFHWYEPIEPPP